MLQIVTIVLHFIITAVDYPAKVYLTSCFFHFELPDF